MSTLIKTASAVLLIPLLMSTSGCASRDETDSVHSTIYYKTHDPYHPDWDDDRDIIIVPPPNLPEKPNKPERPIKPPSIPKPPVKPPRLPKR